MSTCNPPSSPCWTRKPNHQAAQAKLDALLAGPNQAEVDAARQKLEYAKHTLAEMQLTLDDVNSHPTSSELQAAEDEVRGLRRRSTPRVSQPRPATPPGPT